MAYARLDPYDTTAPSPTQGYEAPKPPTVQTSTTPAPQTSYTPPPNAGSWNPYYQQPGTTQAPQAPAASPYTMGSDFAYNTGGPAATQLGQYGNTLEGFEASKLSDPAKTSAKYMFGRLASRYAPTQQGFAQLVQDPEFQRLGMQSIGNGKIRLPNGDVIDVVRGFNSGGQAWQWGAEMVNGQPTDFAGPAQAPQADPWAAYQQQVQQQQQAWQQQWQDYYNQIAAWQAQQAMQQTPTQVWEQPSTPAPYTPPQTGYYQPTPAVQASPNYGGYGYNTGVALQSGGGSPYAQTFNYLAQGMPSPYYYG